MLNSRAAQRFSESYESERFPRLTKERAAVLTFVRRKYCDCCQTPV